MLQNAQVMDGNGGFSSHSSLLQSCGDSSEEELSVLPRHTKVVVTGNNRTKSVLVGLQGVVKKAVGLGGWHWLVLTNGIEVKLQRNALSVIEAPTGNEEDDDFEFEHVQWNGSASNDTQKSHRSRHRMHRSFGLSHKSIRRSLSCDSQSKDSVSTTRGSTVDSNPNPSKEQLIDVVQKHFMSQDLEEEDIIKTKENPSSSRYHFTPSVRSDDVIIQPPSSGSVLSLAGSTSGNERLTVERALENTAKRHISDTRDEGPSNFSDSSSSPSASHTNASSDGEKKTSPRSRSGRMKKLKRYFCFKPL